MNNCTPSGSRYQTKSFKSDEEWHMYKLSQGYDTAVWAHDRIKELELRLKAKASVIELLETENADLAAHFDQCYKELESERRRADRFEKLVSEHNKECEETCKLWREDKSCSMSGYKRACPECPKDWMIDVELENMK